MTAYKFTSHHQLKDILNNVETVQKKDIQDYAGGHLNENLLYKPPSTWASSKWTAGKDKPMPMVKRSQLVHESKPNEKEKKMKDILYDFSIGTSGTVPMNTARTPSKLKKRYSSKSNLTPITQERIDSAASEKSLYSQLDDGVLVEELKAEEMMIPMPTTSRTLNSAASKKLHPDEFADKLDLKNSASKDFIMTFKHQFMPTHHIGVTKTDQYYKLRAFEYDVLRKQDSSEQNVLSGQKAVEHLERRLEQRLDSMQLFDVGPNFHKLQIYSDVMEDLIEETPTFTYILRCIKTEYDEYISRLLEAQTPQHSKLLRDQVEQMSNRGTSRPKELQDAKDRVEKLEQEAQNSLDKNDRLRKEVEQELQWLAKTPDPPEPKHAPIVTSQKNESPPELEDEVEHVKALILEKLDELNNLRIKLREEHVPLTVCTHLEQCIKETEVEVQKLLKQNEYFERSIAEMEADLKEAIQEADTSERDARRIWRKVNSRRGIPHMQNMSPAGFTDSDDDDDDESKWSWYIS